MPNTSINKIKLNTASTPIGTNVFVVINKFISSSSDSLKKLQYAPNMNIAKNNPFSLEFNTFTNILTIATNVNT